MNEEQIKFLSRFNEVVFSLGYPERGKQTQLAEHYKLTQGATRKWFAGETMPAYSICVDLCKRARVHYEWLMTGRGSKFIEEQKIQNPRISHALEVMQEMSEYKIDQAIRIIETLAEPPPDQIDK